MRRLSALAARPRVRPQWGGDMGHTATSRTSVCRLPEGEAYERLLMKSCNPVRFHKYLMGKQRRWQCAPVYRELSLRTL